LQKVSEPLRSISAPPGQRVERRSQTSAVAGRAPERTSLLRQVVLVDRDIDALRDIAVALRNEFDFHITISGTEALNLLQTGTIDTIVVGQTLYSSTGLNVLAQARQHAPQTHRVLLVNAVEAGAIERGSPGAAPFQVMQRPCNAEKLRELLTTRESADDESPAFEPVAASPHVARSTTETHNPADFEHVVMETAPERPRAKKRSHAEGKGAGVGADALPVIVYTDNAEFYQSIALALQDRHDVRLCTQLERASEFAEMGLCPMLITDRAGTQVELQRISIALRALDANTLIIAAGPPETSATLRKLLGTAALHSFLPKPVSAPLVRLIVESAKRHYLQAKTPSASEPELQTANPPKSLKSKFAAKPPAQSPHFVPSYRNDFNIDSFEDSPWRQALPKIAIGVVAAAIVGFGSWYAWNRLHPSGSLPAAEKFNASLPDESVTDLALGRTALEEGRLTSPRDDNALYYYNRVLARSPQNADAVAGRDRTIDRIIEQAEKALLEERVDAAAEAITAVRSVQPANNRLPFLTSQLEKLRRQTAGAVRDVRTPNNNKATSSSDSQIAYATGGTEFPAAISNEAQRQQLITRSLATARQRLAQDRLLAPENDSAEFYFRQAERADPDNTAVRQGLKEIGARLIAEAREALAQQQLDLARRRANDAIRFGADRGAIDRLQSDIDTQSATSTRASYLRMVLQRTRENRLFDPDRDCAKYFLGQLQNMDSSAPETLQATRAFAIKLIENADQSIGQRQLNTAQQLLNEARKAGFSGEELTAAETRLRAARIPAPAPASTVAAAAPPRVIKIVQPKYPDEAMRAGIAGWVDVAFHITASGDVTEVSPVASNPPGEFATQFERAAVAAISQYKFEARPINDQSITQRMVVRVQFKVQ
jgi:protein TonB